MPRKPKPVIQNEKMGQIVEPLIFSKKQKAAIVGILKRVSSKNIDTEKVIISLQSCCEIGRDLYAEKIELPTVSQVKAALTNIANLSTELAEAIDGADQITEAHLMNASQKSLGDYSRINILLICLKLLAEATGEEMGKIPKKYDRRASAIQVEFIHNALKINNVNIKLSRTATSHFNQIVSVCFEAMGIHSGAEQSIKKYMEYLKEEN